MFDKINKGLNKFQGRSSLSTRIYRIATNTAIDKSRSAAYKYETGHHSFEDGTSHESSGATAVKVAPAAEQLEIRKEMSDCICILFYDDFVLSVERNEKKTRHRVCRTRVPIMIAEAKV